MRDKPVFRCPNPGPWNEVYRALLQHVRPGEPPPPVPLILGGWWTTTAFEKDAVWSATIRWADEHGLRAFLRHGVPTTTSRIEILWADLTRLAAGVLAAYGPWWPIVSVVTMQGVSERADPVRLPIAKDPEVEAVGLDRGASRLTLADRLEAAHDGRNGGPVGAHCLRGMHVSVESREVPHPR